MLNSLRVGRLRVKGPLDKSDFILLYPLNILKHNVKNQLFNAEGLNLLLQLNLWSSIL